MGLKLYPLFKTFSEKILKFNSSTEKAEVYEWFSLILGELTEMHPLQRENSALCTLIHCEKNNAIISCYSNRHKSLVLAELTKARNHTAVYHII